MLFAFMAYKHQFVDKAARFVEKAIEWRMLDLHLERLADIVAAEPESGFGQLPVPAEYRRQLGGAIAARGLCFRYAPDTAPVFSDVDFVIAPGDYVAITGPSGGGKTTLMKVLLGLLEPSAGEVLVDGVPLAAYGPRSFREQVGVVMQDDQLLSGSVADNICFFADDFDLDWMRRCATIAQIDDEIMRMPMGYNTLIGDMGTFLSGGQKQRLLLARALYRRPRILFMDEGTSHLDLALEQRVSAAVRALGVTRIVIAHRPDTIASATRVVRLADGAITEAAVEEWRRRAAVPAAE
jgi:ATP-binding cassette subfamily B protein RaxB